MSPAVSFRTNAATKLLKPAYLRKRVEQLADGETIDEAMENGRDALKATIAALKAKKLPVPSPNSRAVS